MPNNTIKSFAEKAKVSIEEAEEAWSWAKRKAGEKHDSSESAYWALVNNLTQRKLGLIKEERESFSSFIGEDIYDKVQGKIKHLSRGESYEQDEKWAKELKGIWKIINTNCKDYLASSRPAIWRGIDDSLEAAIIDTKTIRRRSKDNSNHYTLLIDNLPSTSALPKRSRSIMAATDKNIAEGYGELHFIIPFDGAKIGISPTCDILDVPIKIFNDKMRLSDFAYICERELGIKDDSFAGFRKFQKNIDSGKISYADFKDAFRNCKEAQFKNFLGELDKAFNPEKSGLKMISTKELDILKKYKNSEIWIDGKVLMIAYTQDDEFQAKDFEGVYPK